MPERDLYGHHLPEVRLVVGTIANTPASSGDKLYATTTDGQRWGPCAWTPHGGILPAKGTSCLLAFPEDGPNPWIIAWIGSWDDVRIP